MDHIDKPRKEVLTMTPKTCIIHFQKLFCHARIRNSFYVDSLRQKTQNRRSSSCSFSKMSFPPSDSSSPKATRLLEGRQREPNREMKQKSVATLYDFNTGGRKFGSIWLITSVSILNSLNTHQIIVIHNGQTSNWKEKGRFKKN